MKIRNFGLGVGSALLALGGLVAVPGTAYATTTSTPALLQATLEASTSATGPFSPYTNISGAGGTLYFKEVLTNTTTSSITNYLNTTGSLPVDTPSNLEVNGTPVSSGYLVELLSSAGDTSFPETVAAGASTTLTWQGIVPASNPASWYSNPVLAPRVAPDPGSSSIPTWTDGSSAFFYQAPQTFSTTFGVSTSATGPFSSSVTATPGSTLYFQLVEPGTNLGIDLPISTGLSATSSAEKVEVQQPTGSTPYGIPLTSFTSSGVNNAQQGVTSDTFTWAEAVSAKELSTPQVIVSAAQLIYPYAAAGPSTFDSSLVRINIPALTPPPAPTPTPIPTPALTPKPKPTPTPKTSKPKFLIFGQTGSSSPSSLTTPYSTGTCSNAVTGATYQVTPTGVLENGTTLSGPVFLGQYPAVDGQHIVACATTPSGKGIWLATNFGRVYAEGTATNFGDMRSRYGICNIAGIPPIPRTGVPISGQKCSTRELNAPIVGITSTPNGNGYWLVGADGGVFNFGSAKFLGSTYSYGITGLSGTHPLNAPVTGMVSTPNGNGYWLVGADGGVFNFGSAQFLGSSYSTFGHAIANPNISFELSAQNEVTRGYLTGEGVGGWLSTGGQK